MVFGVVAGVGQQRIERVTAVGLPGGAMEFEVVGLGAAVDDGGEEDVRSDVDHGRELGISAFVVPFVAVAASGVVAGDVTSLEAGRVDGGRRGAVADQAGSSGEMNGCIKESVSAPFFRRRRSA